MIAETTSLSASEISPWKAQFLGLVLASVICVDVPQEHPIAVIVMGMALVWLLGRFLIAPSAPPNLVSIGMGLFLIVLAMSLPVALKNGTSFYDWALRGFVPLALVGVYFLLPMRSRDDTDAVTGSILVACMLWLALVAFDLLLDLHGAASVRWTILSTYLLIPMDIAGIALIAFGCRVFPDRIILPLFFLLCVAAIGGGYRSHLLIVVSILAFANLHALVVRLSVKRTALISLLAASAMIPFLVGHFWATPSRGDDARAPADVLSLRESVGDEGRLLEFDYTLKQFQSSIFIGKGLAYPIPSGLIFKGAEDRLAQIEMKRGKKYPFVYYSHNSLGYIAMTTGAVGLVTLLILGLGLAYQTHESPKDKMAPLAAIISLVAFSLISAVYLLPAFTIMIGALCAVVAQEDRA